jgi:peroxiredoxin
VKILEQNKYLLSIALILLSGIVWIWLSRADPEMITMGKIPAPQQGFLAPDFSLQSNSGESITLSDLRGQPVLINFWASWCPPCQAEMPAMQRTYQDFQDQGFSILAINATFQDRMEEAADFAAQKDLSFPILFDSNGAVSALYQVRALPTSFFIDAQGLISEVVVGGPMSEALLRSRIDKLIKP